jgi:hypothetical protein
MDSKLAEFLEERRVEINCAVSDIVKLLRPFEKAHGSLKETKDQDTKSYASRVKSNGASRETSGIRGNQLRFERLTSQSTA